MPRTDAAVNLGGYLTVKAAAEFLGVCPSTLRNWDRAGKLRPHRHPMNGYRLYRRDELEALLRSVSEGRRDG
jgi:excisionase family DNA binding protein